MEKVYQIFVSSTYADLAGERRKVSETVAKAGYIPAGMELFPATDQQQLEFIKRAIDRCDYYVVIVGGRYGSLADGNVSFTEKEYEYATSKGIPVLAFLHGSPERIEVGKTDQDHDQARRLEAFRNRLATGRIVDFWTEPQELCTKVVIAVTQAINLAPGCGWIRGDHAVDPIVLQELERLRIENTDMRARLARIDDAEPTFPTHLLGPDDNYDIKLAITRYDTAKRYPRTKVSDEALECRIRLGDLYLRIYDDLIKGVSEAWLPQVLGKAVASVHLVNHRAVIRTTDAVTSRWSD